VCITHQANAAAIVEILRNGRFQILFMIIATLGLMPAPAPTPTLGVPPPWELASPLDKPLTTKEQAIARALQVDATRAVWDQPWSSATLNTQVGRVTIELFKSRTEESAQAGRNEAFAPELDANAGPVWRITIRGNVKLRMLGGLSANATDALYDGVTYIISQRTGELLEVVSGQPK
jgi:hypothetical protein